MDKKYKGDGYGVGPEFPFRLWFRTAAQIVFPEEESELSQG
jgi:hypothetical protein